MVQTRRQYNRWVQERGDGYTTSQSSQSSQASYASFGGFSQHSRGGSDHGIEEQRARYSPVDTTRRHRLPDGEPYNVAVNNHRRREPIR